MVMARATGAVGVAARDVRDATQAQERGRAADEELARAVADLRGRAAATDAGLAAARAGLQRLRALATRLQRDEDAARRREEAARALAAAEAAAAAAARARRRTAGAASAVGMPPGTRTHTGRRPPPVRGCRGRLLAAVGQVESGHGRNPGPSSAGAEGPMQFMPATFAAYGVDGDGDGTADPWDIRDAAPSAAHYLCRSGGGDGPDGVRRALFAYNHAQWYVDLVLDAQRAVEAAAVTG
jgi:soluble lytic murein transglycosylase-like protein